MNPETGRSRGTAFVKFADAAAAAKCVEAGTLPEDGAEGAGGRDKADKPAFRSVLQEQDDSEAPGLWLQGRRMLVTLAVDRGKAQQLAGASKEKHDKRNLYLAREGSKGTAAWRRAPTTERVENRLTKSVCGRDVRLASHHGRLGRGAGHVGRRPGQARQGRAREEGARPPARP